MRLKVMLGWWWHINSMDAGLRHWWLQRLTAVGLIPLTIWFTFSIVCSRPISYAAVVTWLHHPYVAAGLFVYIATLLYHSALGMQSIIEDYVGGDAVKRIAMRLVGLSHLLAGVAAASGLIKIVIVGA